MTLAGIALGGCSSPTQNEPDVVVIETITAPAVPAPAASPDAAGAAVGGLDQFGAFAQQLAARVGLAIVPVGGGQALTGGDYMSDVAWSTIKVPLAMAALASDPTQVDNATAALTVSDNSAAQAMWDSLGSGVAAATAVQQVLAGYGDVTTMVQPEVVRPGYTAFGQTVWPLVDQAQFAAAMPCRDDAAAVLSLMGQISPDQSWGLGRLPGAHFKGGWGPDESGGYLVRQFGVVDTASGQVAVSVAVAPDSGTFEDGIAVLDQVATWLAPRLAALNVGTVC
ncbi:hypothetical protein ACNJ7K_24045 [Rhodococcus aetherivorans]|uniref:hypothetical protein n=1 Tax=Rhodococcus zopfii TaxID=43772 RepID=UPI001F0E1A8F|nr:hypothetical protein [Rhodococcus zopfii]